MVNGKKHHCYHYTNTQSTVILFWVFFQIKFFIIIFCK